MLHFSTKLHTNLVIINQWCLRQLSNRLPALQQHQLLQHLHDAKDHTRTDEEWLNAKEYTELPGPTRIGLFRLFSPGGKLYKSNLVEMARFLREMYGDIYMMKGMLGKPDYVVTHNPRDIEVTYRNEGVWPIRMGLESFTYYRKTKRPEVFQGLGGLVSDQGESWAKTRNKVNPILMKLQNVRQNLPEIDKITTEFLKRLEKLRDPTTHELNTNFHEELKMWAFEAVSFIALNTRMGLMTDNPDPNAQRLVENMAAFFQYSYEYDVVPSFWKYIETPGFKRLIRTYDNITEITSNYIDAAIKKFESENNKEAKSVLEKLCQVDRKVAFVMAMDMLMAGSDTTTSAFITLLYLISKNPEKQAALRKEILTIMPAPNTPLTNENTKNMPYLRACMKEALRITPITPSNFRMAGRDLVLSGYKVPKGAGILMGNMVLCNTDTYFPKSEQFMPERWLKSGEAACPEAKNSNPFVYLPFGFGPRTCIGKRIAEMEIETLLAKLIRNYNITWNGKEDLQYISNIILVPHGDINFKFEPLEN